MDRLVDAYDEGIVLVGGLRALAGEVIHRDFYANYGPGQFYVLAGLFSIFSPGVLVERGWDIAVRSATTVLCFSIVASLVGRSVGVAAYIGSLVWLARFRFAGYPVFPALFFSLLSFLPLLPLYNGKFTAPRILASAAAAATAAFFRYDVGFGIAAAEWFIACVFFGSSFELSRGERWQRVIKFSSYYAIGFGIPILLLIVAYLLLHAVEDLWFDLVRFPIKYYAAMRSLPFPSIRSVRPSLLDVYELSVYLPGVAWLAAVFWFMFADRSAKHKMTRHELFLSSRACTWVVINLLTFSVVFFL